MNRDDQILELERDAVRKLFHPETPAERIAAGLEPERWVDTASAPDGVHHGGRTGRTPNSNH